MKLKKQRSQNEFISFDSSLYTCPTLAPFRWPLLLALPTTRNIFEQPKPKTKFKFEKEKPKKNKAQPPDSDRLGWIARMQALRLQTGRTW